METRAPAGTTATSTGTARFVFTKEQRHGANNQLAEFSDGMVAGSLANGVITLRNAGRLHHIGIGRTHAATPVILLIADLDIRIINATTGELLRQLTLDPNRDLPTPKQTRPLNPQVQKFPMSRDITVVPGVGFELRPTSFFAVSADNSQVV